MYVCVCVYACMYVCAYVRMHVCMGGWMDACMHVCIYGPVSRVPESVSLGDHTIGGGGPGIRSPDSYIYIYIYIYIHSSVCVVCYFDVFQNSHPRSRGSKC